MTLRIFAQPLGCNEHAGVVGFTHTQQLRSWTNPWITARTANTTVFRVRTHPPSVVNARSPLPPRMKVRNFPHFTEKCPPADRSGVSLLVRDTLTSRCSAPRLPRIVGTCSCHLRGWVLNCQRTQHVLQAMQMVHPNQAGSLQGSHGVSRDILAVNDPGIGSGWQQSKQNWTLLAVVG